MSVRPFAAPITALALLATGLAGQAVAAPEAVEPNVVFVLIDDANAAALEFMPSVSALIADQGATLENFLFNQPLCCPSRATMLRGQYSHNTGVVRNNAPDGGFAAFHSHGNEESTVGTWFDDAGYETALIGKYLNGYPDEADLPDTYIPPGWDRWFAVLGTEGSGWNYDVNDDGSIVHYGNRDDDYLTDVLAAEAQQFLAATDDPFFLEITTKAPHLPANPAPRHKRLFKGEKYPKTPAYNERSVEDKPSMVSKLKRLTHEDYKEINNDWRQQLRSLQAVDEMVADLVDTLASQGKLDSTYFLFASDNGLHFGEHRLAQGKNTPYETDIRVPAFIRGPGIAPGTVVDELIGNVDVPVTFADAAGIAPPAFVDGRSFLPLVEGSTIPWRTSYLLERGGKGKGLIGYSGIRTEQYTFVEYDNGEREFYDLATDPYQLTNSYDDMLWTLRGLLGARVAALRDCTAEACRTAEEAPID